MMLSDQRSRERCPKIAAAKPGAAAPYEAYMTISTGSSICRIGPDANAGEPVFTPDPVGAGIRPRSHPPTVGKPLAGVLQRRPREDGTSLTRTGRFPTPIAGLSAAYRGSRGLRFALSSLLLGERPTNRRGSSYSRTWDPAGNPRRPSSTRHESALGDRWAGTQPLA